MSQCQQDTRFLPRPPIITVSLSPMGFPKTWNCSDIWKANSLKGKVHRKRPEIRSVHQTMARLSFFGPTDLKTYQSVWHIISVTGLTFPNYNQFNDKISFRTSQLRLDPTDFGISNTMVRIWSLVYRYIFYFCWCKWNNIKTDCRKDLVGARTSAKMPYGSSHNFCSMGKANAAVFPLPVFAHPIQSRPESKSPY